MLRALKTAEFAQQANPSDPHRSTSADATPANGFDVDGLIQNAAHRPELIPSFNRVLSRFERAPSHEVKEKLLVSGDVEVKELGELVPGRRQVAMVVDRHWVGFNSPIDATVWHVVLQENHANVAHSSYELLANLKKSASRLVSDPDFRGQFPSVRKWFDSLNNDNPVVGRQGIVCGGERLTDVRISNNTIRGFWEGIRVGVSKRQAPGTTPAGAGSVLVRDNRIELRVGIDADKGLLGLFVGNAQRVTVENNEVINWLNGGKKMYQDGIRLWGHLGAFIVLRHNSTRNCELGIRVEPIEIPDNCLWRAVDNLAIGGGFAFPEVLIDRDNQTIPALS